MWPVAAVGGGRAGVGGPQPWGRIRESRQGRRQSCWGGRRLFQVGEIEGLCTFEGCGLKPGSMLGEAVDSGVLGPG